MTKIEVLEQLNNYTAQVHQRFGEDSLPAFQWENLYANTYRRLIEKKAKKLKSMCQLC